MTLRKWIVLGLIFSTLVGCERWSSGDRVLVSKINYHTSFTPPRRYDVVVFKYPGRNENEGPMDKNTPKNYIKRLLGLPGELLAIFFGKVYRWSPGKNDPPKFDEQEARRAFPNEPFRAPYMHMDENPARHWFETGFDENSKDERRFEILRKPPHQILALRRIVHDNDYQAKDLKGKIDRWNPAGTIAWKSDSATGFMHDGSGADGVDWLRYQHLVRPTDGPIVGGAKIKPRLITDSMDYNSFQSTGGDDTPRYPHWVGDLMIECNVDVLEAKGEFWFELSRGIQRFQARWNLTDGQCTLYRLGKDGTAEEFSSQVTRVKGPGSYMLRFANFDARLTVWVDRELPFGDGMEYDPPEIRGPKDKDVSDVDIMKRRGPTENDVKRPASIGSKGAHVKVTHVRVWRDTYYTASASSPDYSFHGDMDQEFWSEPDHWKPFREQRFTTLYVQPGHYLCLGDNSQKSSDSRDWGVVPERLMLGRALVVYYPFERMGLIR